MKCPRPALAYSSLAVSLLDRDLSTKNVTSRRCIDVRRRTPTRASRIAGLLQRIIRLEFILVGALHFVGVSSNTVPDTVSAVCPVNRTIAWWVSAQRDRGWVVNLNQVFLKLRRKPLLPIDSGPNRHLDLALFHVSRARRWCCRNRYCAPIE